MLSKGTLFDDCGKGEEIMEEKKLTGYPSIDKPWLKYYSEKAIHSRAPECTMYEYLRQCNANELDDTALFYLGRRISYGNLFQNIESVASAFSALGIHKGDIVTIALPNIPENIYAIYALNKIGAVVNLIDLRAKGKDLLQSYSEVNAQIVIVCDLFLQNTLDIVDQTSIRKIIVASPFDSSHELIRIFSRIRAPKWKKHYCELLISWNDFVKNWLVLPLRLIRGSRRTPRAFCIRAEQLESRKACYWQTEALIVW